MSLTKVTCTSTDAALPFADFAIGALSNISEHKGVANPEANFVRFDVGKTKGRMANVAELMVAHNANISKSLLLDQDGKSAGKVKDGDVVYVSESVPVGRKRRIFLS